VVRPDGQQQILRHVPDYQIEVFDLRRHSKNSVNAHLETIRQQMSHEIFAAESWPLFKFCATQVDTNCYRLHLSFDALIADAWSLMILGQQWLEMYYNPQTELPKVEISFRDYILAEIQLKDTPHYQQSQKYWWDRIATLPSAPELPFVQQPAALKQPQFKRFSAKLTAQQWQKLKSKARAINLTGSGILLAAFSDVLAYWSKSPNFTINLTLFNRLPLHPQVNQIVGDFTSLTLLEVDNSIVATFVERAQRLQARLWEDLDHRYVSGVEVQRELRRQRGTYQAMGVVFTSTLGFSDMAQQDWLVNQLGEMVYSITQTPQVWLDHQVTEEEGALLFNWDAIEELFPANLLDDMFSSYCNYLQQLATDEKIWMEKYPTLLPPQQLEIIQQLNQVNQLKTVTSEQTLDGLFVQQVKQRGASLAAIAPELCLTYEQLYQHAVKLGHQLRSLGATTGTHIAVVMNKGWEQIVAVLGVLMAGCTYVPIDPGLPQQRQWSLLTQAQIQLVVTQEALYQSLSWPEEIECVYVEYNPHIGVQRTLERLHQPGDLAYIIYTSGSTGIPKGVMIDHQGAVNTIIDINQRFGVTADDRVLAVSALNFDLSVYDIFGTLAAGGTIVIPTAAKAKDPAHWLSLINGHHVTVWNSVPALMQMLVEYTSAQSTQQHHPLRLALLSGDWIPLNLPQQIKAIWTGIEVVSLGGATEASIWSIYYPIGEVDPNWRSIPYGKPLGNQTMHVLNQWMEPAPVWVPGQIYIGGLGLAQGYWKDDEKTAKHFVLHPLTQERLYKTGDLGRYLPDGNIEFLGREDFQVKINGYRIELGEIEATLMRNSLVNKAVVNAIADSRDRKKIVAYIVPSETQAKLPEAYYPSEKEGIITDPVERIEFKLKQPGLRNLESTNKGIDLPLDIDEEALTQAYFQRQSYRQFQQQPLELPEFSQFLSCLRQLSLANKPLPKYLYPSAGNLYPVQTYLMIKSEGLTGVEEGIYYYCPRQHRLVFLSTLINAEGDKIYGGNQPIFEQAAFSLFLIAKLDAIAPMYGELAERFCLLEAGHIGQLLMTKAPEFGIGLCPIGNLDFQQIGDLFKLDSHQMLLYSFVGGKIEPAQAQQWLTSSVSPAKSSGDADPISQLRKHLQLHLPDYMLPSKLMLLDALPLSANGKIDRRALPVPDNLHDLEEETFVAPRDLVELKLTQIWSEVLNVFPVGVQSNFFDLGGDSIVAIRLMAQIEEQFQRNLSLATLFQGQTIEKLATVLREESDHISWSPLVPIQTSGYQPPFFCIAGGGGNVLYFYHLSRYLGQEQPFYALQAVGLDGESEPFTRVEDMAAHYIGLIKSIQPEGPYFLGGHSFGGLVAFEVAQQLQKHGNEVALLAILDMHAPDTERPKPGSHKLDTDWDSAKMLTSIASIFGRMFGKNIDVSYEFLQQLTFEEQLNYVNERFQMVNIFPPETGIKQIRGLIQVARASQNACYVPQEVYPTQITLFRASDEVPIELAPSVDIYRLLYDSRKNDPMWGWSEFSAGEVELHPVPGDHLTIMTEPYIGALAEKLKSSLEKAQTANPMGRP
ncbi:MAG: amino acid adenylation domain-containing protein, partial [Moorea sp. SIO4G2]|nr:amino acid adenylation domain-containing protein [Moorena sp. SIO4G2]